jgi:hypothetical protein
VSGFTLASTGDQTVNSTGLPRYTSGLGVWAWLEITTQPSNPPPVVSLASYTNQDGTASRVGPAYTFPVAAMSVHTLVGPLPLQAGDTGIRSVETFNVATAGGAGVANLILVRPLLLTGTRDAVHVAERISPLPFTTMPRIYDGASLEVIIRGQNPDVEAVSGELDFILAT